MVSSVTDMLEQNAGSFVGCVREHTNGCYDVHN